ncbi:MAG: RluA family pseudouridine synthase [Clostridia bacterium]|nr:RluA family pseudouridine synthase [Clostridia bacterium]
MREFTVAENDGGQRLDRFITKLMPKLPKSMLYKGLRKKCVRLNGSHEKDGAVFVSAGDVVTLYFADEFFEADKSFGYVKPVFKVAYEDENILVVDKPVGVLCHSDENGKGKTLIDMVKSYLWDKGEYNPENEQTFSPALCNRLDRNTGGLVIAAKNAKALRDVNDSIKNRNIRKFYMAMVEGDLPHNGHLEDKLERSEKVTKVSDTGKSASLDYEVLSRKNGQALVSIELHTGRTHQIRTQFANIGCPLVGDTKYGGKGKSFRQALYATKLILNFDDNSSLSYLNGKEIEITAPFEGEF